MYNDNGDMVAEAGQVFRQIGWRISGGDRDGDIVPMQPVTSLDDLLARTPNGGYSPIYIEVGTD